MYGEMPAALSLGVSASQQRRVSHGTPELKESQMKRVSGVVLMGMLVATAACSDSTGVDGTGPVEVTLRMDGSALTGPAFGGSLGSSASLAGVSPDQVESLFVLVTSVSFLPVDTAGNGEGEGEESEWVFIELETAVRVDLMALPTDEDSAFVDGELPVGEYAKIRLQVSDAAVWFKEAVTQGPTTLDPGVEHPVDVPSGSTSGIKTDVGFTVESENQGETAVAALIFDPGLTFSNLTVTGNGKVVLSPVFKTP
jgi:hypothetical protein